MKPQFIRAGGEIINLSQVARVGWRDTTLFINTTSGFVRVDGREASLTWATLEELLTFDASTGQVKQLQE